MRALARVVLAMLAPTASAGVEIRTPVLDFGEAIRGDMVASSAEFANGAPIEVEIRVAALGCGCLESEGLTLAPGAAGRLAVRLDTGKTAPGFVQRFVVFRAEPDGELLTVEIRGTVHPPFRAAPQVLRIPASGEPLKLELRGAIPFEVSRLLEPSTGWSWFAPVQRLGKHVEVSLHRTVENDGSAPKAFVFELKHRLGTGQVEVPASSPSPTPPMATHAADELVGVPESTKCLVLADLLP